MHALPHVLLRRVLLLLFFVGAFLLPTATPATAEETLTARVQRMVGEVDPGLRQRAADALAKEVGGGGGPPRPSRGVRHLPGG